MTDKSDDKVGHLNTILAQGGGNLNDSIFKSSNARGGGGGMLKFRVDRCIIHLEVGYCWDLRDFSFYRFRACNKKKVGKMQILVMWL